jgi:GTP diphosphokinase / guanosine-3',5'-bis(diphosphate) 3'-diphosphatase
MERRFQKILNSLLADIRAYNEYIDQEAITQAYEFAYKAHEGQRRKSGAPYFEHCIDVVQAMVDLHMDQVTLLAALLHDVVEDTGITVKEIEIRFGEDVAKIVDGLTKIADLQFEKREIQQVENFRKMLLSMVDDIRVILIKFGDRLHNMRTLDHVSKEKQIRIARETLDVYAPLAHRLGMANIRWELEDLCFKYLHPDEYDDLVKKVRVRQLSEDKFVEQVKKPLLLELGKAEIKAHIEGRAKSLYSINRKIQNRKVSLDQIFDLYAIRIIVDKVEDCYFALGIVHTLFAPNHDHFKDFIATPKMNNYQSIHTKVIGPHGKMVEIQIRTWRMHRIAEVGIAAHVRYKEGRARDDGLDRHLNWLRKLVEYQQDTNDPAEFMENLKVDLFRDEVFVFTPMGDLLNLPMDATVIDFAYMVHSSIGQHCSGAKVNSRLVPLSTRLRNGDAVEIITSTRQWPQREWLNFVKTAKARQHIKRYIRQQEREQSIKLGEELLKKELGGIKVKNLKRRMAYAVDYFSLGNVESLYNAMGQGLLSPRSVALCLLPELETRLAQRKVPMLRKLTGIARRRPEGIRIQGDGDLLMKFADCCYPIPGDFIIGYLAKGEGVTIHRANCQKIVQDMTHTEQIVHVEWEQSTKKVYTGSIKFIAKDRQNFLLEMSQVIAETATNISDLNMQVEDGLVHGNMCIDVTDIQQLEQVMEGMQNLQGTVEVSRFSDHSEN